MDESGGYDDSQDGDDSVNSLADDPGTAGSSTLARSLAEEDSHEESSSSTSGSQSTGFAGIFDVLQRLVPGASSDSGSGAGGNSSFFQALASSASSSQANVTSAPAGGAGAGSCPNQTVTHVELDTSLEQLEEMPQEPDSHPHTAQAAVPNGNADVGVVEGGAPDHFDLSSSSEFAHYVHDADLQALEMAATAAVAAAAAQHQLSAGNSAGNVDDEGEDDDDDNLDQVD